MPENGTKVPFSGTSSGYISLALLVLTSANLKMLEHFFFNSYSISLVTEKEVVVIQDVEGID